MNVGLAGGSFRVDVTVSDDTDVAEGSGVADTCRCRARASLGWLGGLAIATPCRARRRKADMAGLANIVMGRMVRIELRRTAPVG